MKEDQNTFIRIAHAAVPCFLRISAQGEVLGIDVDWDEHCGIPLSSIKLCCLEGKIVSMAGLSEANEIDISV